MLLLEWTLILLLIAVLLTGFARRIGMPYPSLLALAGAGLAFVPGGPTINIDPELALALFVGPALFDSAFDTSPRDLKRNVIPLASLVVVMVALTTAVVGFIGWRYGGLPIAAAIALGAIVAPPDAVAAAAVLNQLSLPRRVLVLLQGESLLNDASALIIYRLAVAAAVGGVAWAQAAPWFALAAVGSVAVGYVLARVFLLLTLRVQDAASNTILGLVGTIGMWILADRLGLSAIITMVVFAMTIAQLAPSQMPARVRISSYSVWETLVFVLNVLAFVIMGLQVRPILDRLAGAEREQALIFGAVVLAAVVLVRIIYVLGVYNTFVRVKNKYFGVDLAPGLSPPTWKSGLLVSWCGMRGLVTLATAFALPIGFPGRDVIVLSAFMVVLGTLVFQGLTLKPLLAVLKFKPDDAVDQEVSHARVAMMQTALDVLADETSVAAVRLRKSYIEAQAVAEDVEAPQGSTEEDELRLRAIVAQRRTLAQLRSRGEISDEAYHRLEEEIDWAELNAAPAGYFQPLTTDGAIRQRRQR
ncbi:MAG TPA: cation:proton antiporter [Caulobacterales bacterium]|nr:cation:proton antiporter [Caulobacterales bacterium]